MILVDTSVWVDHLRTSDHGLARLLESGQVVTHPFVIGELALGNLRQRDLVLGALDNLPKAVAATELEVFSYIQDSALHGLGIGYVDAHLLAAVRLTPHCRLWSRDRRLQAAAEERGLGFRPEG